MPSAARIKGGAGAAIALNGGRAKHVFGSGLREAALSPGPARPGAQEAVTLCRPPHGEAEALHELRGDRAADAPPDVRGNGRPGATGHKLIELLERRLDNIVFRAGFARTIPAARQLVNHGHIEVDGRRVDIASFRVSQGQVISVREKSKKLPPVLAGAGVASTFETSWLEVDRDGLHATVIMVDDVVQRGEAAVVMEAAFLARAEGTAPRRVPGVERTRRRVIFARGVARWAPAE